MLCIPPRTFLHALGRLHAANRGGGRLEPCPQIIALLSASPVSLGLRGYRAQSLRLGPGSSFGLCATLSVNSSQFI
ncbi:hypothetical protein PGT21_006369 [Puccinia graminis f. sp. tritici]|uniref:Uncharacterized protein n=1 Tax=Puccinia graminis f. sp. tritici TaxID=56615 RepID=A0A5B0QSJ2_PUCGR|nr:hypothetical protein PGT21_006369 [Puccinia graminis f. sp. tritici]